MKIKHELLGELEVPEEPRRIVSLAPNVTDTLFALGAAERMVGRSAFCWRPEEAQRLPVLSSYTKVRWQLLKELEPDLIFTTTAVQTETTKQLHERGYAVWPVPLPSSPWGIIENIHLLAAIIDRVAAAAELAATLLEEYMPLKGLLEGVKVYLEYDLGGPITIGRGAFMNAALAHLGAENIYSFKGEAYFAPDISFVARANPDLAIFEPKRIKNREAQLTTVSKLLEERKWRIPWIATRGDELAHFGPAFFDYFSHWAVMSRKKLEK